MFHITHSASVEWDNLGKGEWHSDKWWRAHKAKRLRTTGLSREDFHDVWVRISL